jgi:hypothetical protein
VNPFPTNTPTYRQSERFDLSPSAFDYLFLFSFFLTLNEEEEEVVEEKKQNPVHRHSTPVH